MVSKTMSLTSCQTSLQHTAHRLPYRLLILVFAFSAVPLKPMRPRPLPAPGPMG